MSGVLRGLFSPVTAVSGAFVRKPVERAAKKLGAEPETAETIGTVARIGAELATPGIGLTKAPEAIRKLVVGPEVLPKVAPKAVPVAEEAAPLVPEAVKSAEPAVKVNPLNVTDAPRGELVGVKTVEVDGKNRVAEV